ncbi:MAG: hypothetical protein RI906_3213 [Pseudomonadota bacterium]|jgi:DNA-binding response OmpR family regulator
MLERILVVDGDDDIRDLFAGYLRGHGYSVNAVADGAGMFDQLTRNPADLVLLDQRLPGGEGLTLAQRLRQSNDVGIITVTGYGHDIDRIVRLEDGADDYVSKPVDFRELLSRIRSVLRRRQTQPAPTQTHSLGARVWRFEGWCLDEAVRSLTQPSGSPVVLTTGEFDLMVLFLGRPNRVISRDELIDLMYHRAAGPYDRAIDVQVARLRRKLSDNSASPNFIKTVRGVGYIFAARVQA